MGFHLQRSNRLKPTSYTLQLPEQHTWHRLERWDVAMRCLSGGTRLADGVIQLYQPPGRHPLVEPSIPSPKSGLVITDHYTHYICLHIQDMVEHTVNIHAQLHLILDTSIGHTWTMDDHGLKIGRADSQMFIHLNPPDIHGYSSYSGEMILVILG